MIHQQERVPGLKTHFISTDVPASLTPEEAAEVKDRSMVVRKLEVVQIEAIVRGYVTGSAFKEYQKSGTVHGIKLPGKYSDILKIYPFGLHPFLRAASFVLGLLCESPGQLPSFHSEYSALSNKDQALTLFTSWSAGMRCRPRWSHLHAQHQGAIGRA